MSEADFCECEAFGPGEWVESRLNPDLFGIVVNDSDFGRIVHVQLAVSMEVKAFYAVTLRHCTADEEPPAKEKTPSADVINFTEQRELRKATKTRGAA